MKLNTKTQTNADWQALKTGLHRFVLSRVPKDDADDVVSDILETIIRNRESLRDATNPSAWIFTIARNKITDFYRSRNRQQSSINALATDPTTGPQAQKPTGGMRQNPSELANCLSGVIADMADTDQTVLHEIDLKNTRQTEFAIQHGIALPTVKSRVQRARKRLRDKLIACCPDGTANNCDAACHCTA